MTKKAQEWCQTTWQEYLKTINPKPRNNKKGKNSSDFFA